MGANSQNSKGAGCGKALPARVPFRSCEGEVQMSTTVAEIMHDGVEWVPPDAKLSQVARIMKEKDIGGAGGRQ